MLTNKRYGLFAAVLAGAALTVAGAPVTDAEARGRSRHSYQGAKSYAGKSYGKWSRNSAARYSRSKPLRADRENPTPVAAAPVPAPPPAQQAEAPRPAATVPQPAGPAFVGLAAGGVTSTSARVASDLSAVLDGNSVRVLPLMTRASLSDAIALAAADKADLVFLHGDAIDSLPENGRAALSNRIAYVARLYNDEVHVVASREIKDIRGLAGKKVNVGPEGSANAQTAELMFDRLGIAPQFVHVDQPTALAKMAEGELAADVLVSGRPVKALQDFAGDGRFRLLPVPYDAALQDIYLPARIEASDYGNLVPTGGGVDTLAVPIVLATIDAPAGSPRAARVGRFTRAFFDRFDILRDPARHPKWRDVNLAATVANWTRFAAAQDAIDRTTARSVATGAKEARR